VAQRRVESPLAHELPYWSFFDDDGLGVAINVDGTYSTFVELTGVDVECFDEERRGQLSGALHAVLQNLPAGTVVQLLRWTDRRLDEQLAAYRASASGEGSFGRMLVDGKARHAAEHPALRRNALVLVVSRPPKSARPAGGLSLVSRKFPSLSVADNSEALRQLRGAAGHVSHGLAGAGVIAHRLTSLEARTLVYQLLHPARAQLIPEPFAVGAPALQQPWADEQTAREQLVFAGIEEERTRLLVDSHLVRVLTVKELPAQTVTAMLDSLNIVFDFDCRVHFAVQLLDQADALDQLKTKRDRAQMLVELRRKRNQEAEAQAEDLGSLIDESLRSTLRIVQVAVSVVLTVDATRKDAAQLLEQQTSAVLRELNRLHGAQGLVDEYAQLDEFLATLPANARHGRRWLRCTSHNAAHLLPVSSAGPATPLRCCSSTALAATSSASTPTRSTCPTPTASSPARPARARARSPTPSSSAAWAPARAPS
jgi:type IV secretory pathway VirB4 component